MFVSIISRPLIGQSQLMKHFHWSVPINPALSLVNLEISTPLEVLPRQFTVAVDSRQGSGWVQWSRANTDGWTAVHCSVPVSKGSRHSLA